MCHLKSLTAHDIMLWIGQFNPKTMREGWIEPPKGFLKPFLYAKFLECTVTDFLLSSLLHCITQFLQNHEYGNANAMQMEFSNLKYRITFKSKIPDFFSHEHCQEC